MERRDGHQDKGWGQKAVTEGLSLGLYMNLCIGPQVQVKPLQNQDHGFPSEPPGCAGLGPGETDAPSQE